MSRNTSRSRRPLQWTLRGSPRASLGLSSCLPLLSLFRKVEPSHDVLQLHTTALAVLRPFLLSFAKVLLVYVLPHNLGVTGHRVSGVEAAHWALIAGEGGLKLLYASI